MKQLRNAGKYIPGILSLCLTLTVFFSELAGCGIKNAAIIALPQVGMSLAIFVTGICLLQRDSLEQRKGHAPQISSKNRGMGKV